MKKQHRVQLAVVSIIAILVSLAAVPSFSALPLSADTSPITSEKHIALETMTMDLQQTKDALTISLHVNPFTSTSVPINGVSYQQISIDQESNLQQVGLPALPTICRSIRIPDTAAMNVNILKTSMVEYHDVLLAPSKGNLLRNVDPTTVPYQFDPLYTKDQWFPESIVTLGQPYIFRDIRGQAFTVIPFQYNPVQKILRFYTDITFEIIPQGTSEINTISRASAPTVVDPSFSQLYQEHFLNYDLTGTSPREEDGSMLIITYDSFWQQIAPIAVWKAQRGINTKIVNVSTIGNANAIKNYIAAYYHSHTLTYVLLVGDAEQVPTLFVDGCASDPSYTYIVGTDHDPDICIGRFSAQTADQVQTQVNRTIMYEKYPQVGATWYQKGTGIGSNEGPGDDNEYDWEHIRNIRSDLLNYTYTAVDELYDGTHGGGDAPGNPSASNVRDVLNAGRSIVNYCGHGSPDLWGTTMFSSSDVNTLTNVNKLPFIFSVACENGQFTPGTCFAEAWLRAEYNGQPIGAIAAFMSSKLQGWNPPMEAEDAINNLLVTNQKNTIGELCVGGCIQMNDHYGADGDAETDAWHIFGDPSLQVRTDIPSTITVHHNSSVPFNNLSFDVTVTGGNNSICTLSKGISLYGAGYADETGYAHIVITKPLPFGTTVTLTVSGYNQIPYTASIEVTGTDLPPETPVTPTGPSFGIVKRNSSITTSTTDPDGNQILYEFEFGDGSFSDWIGPNESGVPCTVLHQWEAPGKHAVRVRAQDIYGFTSNWSDPLEIRVIRGTFINILLNFLEKFAPQLYEKIIERIQG